MTQKMGEVDLEKVWLDVGRAIADWVKERVASKDQQNCLVILLVTITYI